MTPMPLRASVFIGLALGVIGYVVITTLGIAFQAGPAFLLGPLLFGVPCFGAGLLTMYAYVSSLGWER